MDQNNRCNLKCRMCGFSDPRVAGLRKFDMPFWLFEKIASEVFPRTSYVALSCLTEPYMTRDFDDRLAIVGRAGIPFTEVITNGTLLNDAHADALIDAGISRVAISIDGATKETYERIRVGASFEKVVANVRLLTARKAARGAELPSVRINHVLTEENETEFPLFLELVESLRPQGVDVRTAMRMSDALYQGTDDPVFYGKVTKARDELEAFCARTGIANVGILRWQPTVIELFGSTGEKVTCKRPWNTVAIHANGDVMPCISWTRPPYGNLARQSFADVWDGAALAEIREQFTIDRPGIDCEHCVIKKSTVPEEDDDFFYRMIAKGPAEPAPAVVPGVAPAIGLGAAR
jgi:radical SAM protein with 4Fe4S-binding SPASM domain